MEKEEQKGISHLDHDKSVITPSAEGQRGAWYEWHAREYEPKKRETGWFVGMGALTLGLIIFGIFARSYFFIMFVALAFLVILMYAKRTPRQILFTLGPDGVRAGNKLFAYSELTSFHVFHRSDLKELSLETKKKLQPYVQFPLDDADPKEIKIILAEFLPEKDHPEFFSDKIARKIGL